MREMVISAFIARADTELQRLAEEIAKVAAGASTTTVKKLWERFTELQKAAAEHEAVLSGAVGEHAAGAKPADRVADERRARGGVMMTTVQVRVAAGFADEAAEIEWGGGELARTVDLS